MFFKKIFSFNMDSIDEEVLVIAVIPQCVLENKSEKNTEENCGWSHGCNGFNLEYLALYCKKWSLKVSKTINLIWKKKKKTEKNIPDLSLVYKNSQPQPLVSFGPKLFYIEWIFFRVNTRPVWKESWYLVHKVENMKNCYCENNYNLPKYL